MSPQQTPGLAQPSREQPQAQSCSCACSCGRSQDALFVDEEFPARWHVLPNAALVAAWLRPHEIRKEPRLFVEGCSRFGVIQGCLGDCWFMAACAAVVERQDLLKQIIPEGQVLYGPGYDGSVTFRLWHQGEWKEMRIDDRIPVDARGVPVYARCKHKDEFWLPLLEKAFAKFHKHFGGINGGWPSEGLVNLTGYSMQQLDVQEWNVWNIDDNFEKLKKAFEIDALVLCVTLDKSAPGIPDCHAYTVTKVFQRIPKKEEEEEKLQLVRIRNPWGGGCKWKGGAWKDEDERWDKLSPDIKDALDYKPEENGEFWMSMEDFSKLFTHVTISSPTPFGAEKMKLAAYIPGKWTNDENAGGDHNEIEKFTRNPQFLLVALGAQEADAEEKDDEPINLMEGMEAIVELQRGHCRKNMQEPPDIAFYMFETCTERRLTVEQMQEMTYVTGATEFERELSVSCTVRLHPGRRYVIVPTTKYPGKETDFLLRVFSRQARVHLSQLQWEPEPTESASPTAQTPP